MRETIWSIVGASSNHEDVVKNVATELKNMSDFLTLFVRFSRMTAKISAKVRRPAESES